MPEDFMEVIQHKSDRRQHQALERSYSGVFLIQQDINKHQSWDQCATGPPKQVMNSISHWGNPAELSISMNMFTCGSVNTVCT